jgi:hypothetical protein
MTNTFVSVSNFKDLINILTQYFKDKHNIDINTISSLNLKQVFFGIIKKVASDSQNDDKTLMEKNKLVLTIIKEIIKEEYKFDNLRDSIYTNRENMVSTYPSQTRTNTNDVNQQFETLQNQRTHVSSDTNQALPETKTFADTSLSPDDFKVQIKSLETDRSTFDKSLKALFPHENNRNFEVSDIINNDIASTDVKSFFQTNLENDSIKDVKNIYEKSQIELVGSTNDVSTFKVKKIVIIDTANRNWINFNSRFDFSINLFSNSKEITTTPYYINNEYIPFTKSDISDGILNENGFKIDTEVFQPFNPSQNLNGTTDEEYTPIIKGHENIPFLIDNISMLSAFKKISSISINNLILPLGIAHRASGVNAYKHHNYYNYPYIILCIDELQGVYDGTNNTISKAFCQLSYKDFVKLDEDGINPSQRGSLVLSPTQHSEKVFFPTPLQSLNSLTISLYNPSGQLLSNQLDNHVVSSLSSFEIINLDASFETPYGIRITLDDDIHVNDFYTNDTVLLKNFFVYQSTTSVIAINEINAINHFVNSQNGHKILDFSVDTHQIIISLPNDLYSPFNSILSDTSVSISTCYVLNMTLQYSISFSVETHQNYNASASLI